jgi:hypothetical protein
VAREAGMGTRSRTVFEALPTMWQREPYFPEAASQSVAMVTRETVD